jgi:putative ABC transport system permease protein
MWFLTMVVKNLWQRKVRTILTCLGMGIAVCAVVTMVGVADVFERAVTQLFETRGVDMVVTRAGAAQHTASNLPQALGDRLLELPGVDSVEPMLLNVVSFQPEFDLVAVYVMGWDPAGAMFKQLHFASGRELRPDDHNGVILGSMLAKSLDKKVGDHLAIEGMDLTVIGISSSNNVFENSSAVMALPDLQRMMDRPKQVTTFLVRVQESADKRGHIDTLKKEIDELTDPRWPRLKLSALSTEENVQSTLELRVVQGMAWSTSVIALVIGVIGMLNTMMISVFERTREIGTLRAVGWSARRVVRLILLETLVLSVIGAVVGTAMSLGLTWVLSAFPSASALILPTNVTPKILIEAFLLAIVAGLFGATYPAAFAARLLPTEALRHD